MLNISRLNALKAPVLDRPVVILESDDWGPGPEEQSQALDSIRTLLVRFKDEYGRSPVMTIGVILSIPNSKKIADTGEYHALFLDDPCYHSVVEALKRGVREGVFDLQLHGLAHFWPSNFMALLNRDTQVQRWLEEDGWRTEMLPSWVQSRWIDAYTLPSKHLPLEAIQRAVQEEIKCFHCCFDYPPKVVVPPTFVWNEDVERVYAKAGIEVLITPGQRYPGRDADGKLTIPDRQYINGERLSCGMVTLVRDVYFEPSLEHSPHEVLEKIGRKWEKCEPALLETHRFNFFPNNLQSSLQSLERLLMKVIEQYPNVRFLSSYELAMSMPAHSFPWGMRHIRVGWRRVRG